MVSNASFQRPFTKNAVIDKESKQLKKRKKGTVAILKQQTEDQSIITKQLN